MANGFNAPGVVKPFGIFSSAAWQPPGRVLHISGHVSQDVDGNIVHEGDMAAQTRRVLENLAAWEQGRAAMFADPGFQASAASSNDLIVSGRHEFYTIEAAN